MRLLNCEKGARLWIPSAKGKGVLQYSMGRASQSTAMGAALTSGDAGDPSYGARDHAGLERVSGEVVGSAGRVEHGLDDGR